MTRVFTEGFEMGDNAFFDGGGVIVSITSVAVNVRSGTFAANCGGGVSYRNLPTPLTEFYARIGMRDAGLNWAGTLFVWRSGTATLGSVRINTQGKVDFYTGGSTLVASTNIVITYNQYCVLEVHVKLADAGGIIEAKLDGVADASAVFNGDTKPGTETTINNLGYGNSGVTLYYDDLALNDTTGGVDNSWCGDGHVIALIPNGTGDVTQLTPSSAVANYTLVDEIPVATVTPDYVESSTIGQYDLYNLTTADFTGKTIQHVWVEARGNDTVAAGGLCDLGIKTGGAENWSPDLAMLTTIARLVGVIYPTKPAGGAWAQADIDALQVGFKVK